MYYLSTLVPITWNVKYAGIIVQATPIASGEISMIRDISKINTAMIIDTMDGLRVVFYCMILSYGRSSSRLS